MHRNSDKADSGLLTADRAEIRGDDMRLAVVSGTWAGTELCRAVYRDHWFPVHAHPGVHVAVIERGRYRFRRDGRSFRAAAGDLVVLGPDQGHDGGGEDATGYAYRQILIPVPLWGAASQGTVDFRPADPILRVPGAGELVRTVFRARKTGDAMLFDAGLARLAEVVARREPEPVETGTASPTTVRRAVAILEERFAEPWTLAELAAAVGSSRFVLSRAFRRDHGIGLHDWLMNLRLYRARGWMAAGMSPSEAAMAAGFADQSHLNRHFKRIFGLTPGRFRAACTSIQDGLSILA